MGMLVLLLGGSFHCQTYFDCWRKIKAHIKENILCKVQLNTKSEAFLKLQTGVTFILHLSKLMEFLTVCSVFTKLVLTTIDK